MTGSYLLVLQALRLAAVSYVAPARELGIVFGTLLGVFEVGALIGGRERGQVRRAQDGGKPDACP